MKEFKEIDRLKQEVRFKVIETDHRLVAVKLQRQSWLKRLLGMIK